MSEYTPETVKARETFIWGTTPIFPGERKEAGEQFDRWLASVERAAAEKAWQEGHDSSCIDWDHVCEATHPNPYRREEA